MGLLDTIKETIMSSDPRISRMRQGILQQIGPMAGRRPVAPTFGELAASLVSGKRQGERDYLQEQIMSTKYQILDDGRIAKIDLPTGKVTYEGEAVVKDDRELYFKQWGEYDRLKKIKNPSKSDKRYMKSLEDKLYDSKSKNDYLLPILEKVSRGDELNETDQNILDILERTDELEKLKRDLRKEFGIEKEIKKDTENLLIINEEYQSKFATVDEIIEFVQKQPENKDASREEVIKALIKRKIIQ